MDDVFTDHWFDTDTSNTLFTLHIYPVLNSSSAIQEKKLNVSELGNGVADIFFSIPTADQSGEGTARGNHSYMGWNLDVNIYF
jgi:hypothetical protein